MKISTFGLGLRRFPGGGVLPSSRVSGLPKGLGEEILDGEGGRGKKRKEGRFSPSALSLFRFHLSFFPPEKPDTQANFLEIGLRGCKFTAKTVDEE